MAKTVRARPCEAPLDSNTVIHLLRGHEGIVARLTSERQVAVAAVVVYEIEVGTIRSKQTGRRRRILSQLFQDIEVVPFDSGVALAAAKIGCELDEQGEGIGPLDTLIAGIAVSRGAVLITSNVREFSRVKGLRMEDWKVEQSAPTAARIARWAGFKRPRTCDHVQLPG